MTGGTDHSIITLPSSRQFTMDVGRLGMRKHHMRALLDIDVTRARVMLKKRKALTGGEVSFTSWIITCLSRALMDNRQAHALRAGGNRIMLFNDTDISLILEKNENGIQVPIPIVLRRVNDKSISDIYHEIESAKKAEIKNEKDYVVEGSLSALSMKLFTRLPQRVRLLFWRILLSSPLRVKALMGTSVITSVGMMGNAHGWAIPFSIHPLCIALGTITEKPGVDGGKIKIREYLPVTVLMDHDIIDGAPAARFLSRLTELIETGFGL